MHFLNVTDTPRGHTEATVSVSRHICIRLVDMAVDTTSPVSMMQLGGADVRRAESVDEFRATFRQLQVFANDVWNPSDLAAFELNLSSFDEIRAMLAKDSVVVVPCDLPDAVIVIPQRQQVWLILIQEPNPGVVVLRDATSLVFWTSPATKRREVPQVATVYSVVRLKVVSELQQLLCGLVMNKVAVGISTVEESFERHVFLS